MTRHEIASNLQTQSVIVEVEDDGGSLSFFLCFLFLEGIQKHKENHPLMGNETRSSETVGLLRFTSCSVPFIFLRVILVNLFVSTHMICG